LRRSFYWLMLFPMLILSGRLRVKEVSWHY
jgi:hypothetical protein